MASPHDRAGAENGVVDETDDETTGEAAHADEDRSAGDAASGNAGDAQSAGEEAAILSVEDRTARPSKRGGKRPGAGRKPSRTSEPKPPRAASVSHIKDIGVGREAAAALLALTEGGLMMAVGPKAAMTPKERGDIEPPLARILARMTPRGAELVATLADPLMLGVALVAYISRITRPETPPARSGSPQPVRVTPEPARTPSQAAQNGSGPIIAAPLTNADATLFAE